MKTIILKASAASLAALLFLPGCNREASIPDISDDVRSETIPLWFEGVNNGPESRVSIAGPEDTTPGAGSWTEGDKVAIYVEDGGVGSYQIKTVESIGAVSGHSGENDHAAVLVNLSSTQNRANYAIYPYSAAVAGHYTQSDLYVTYPDVYDYSSVAAADLAEYTPAPMVAVNLPVDKTDPDHPVVPALDFYHVGGVFRVTVPHVPASAVSLRFTFPAGLKVSGTFEVKDLPTSASTDLTGISLESAGLGDHSNVITVQLPPDVGSLNGNVTLNIPLPYGDYNTSDREYTVEAIASSGIVFMGSTDFVNWTTLPRAQGKHATTPALETRGTTAGLYLTRGYLNRPNISSVDPSVMKVGTEPLEVFNYSSKSYGKQFYFNWNELGKIMTGNSAFDGSTSFESDYLTIDGVNYRVPSMVEWNKIIVGPRVGSTVTIVDGETSTTTTKRDCFYSLVTVNTSGMGWGRTSVFGMLVWPDGGEYTVGTGIKTTFNATGTGAQGSITYAEYRRLCDGPNNCIFLPCAGNLGTNGGWNSVGSNGYYWSSTWDTSTNAYYLNFNSGNVSPSNSNLKGAWFPVRLLRESL